MREGWNGGAGVEEEGECEVVGSDSCTGHEEVEMEGVGEE